MPRKHAQAQPKLGKNSHTDNYNIVHTPCKSNAYIM